MGGGTWTCASFVDYAAATNRGVTTSGTLDVDSLTYSAQDMFTSRRIHADLDPQNVMRECVDSAEHPNTVPVIFALDVTGSMGATAVEAAKQLNVIMNSIFEKVQDVEFMIMGIGDLTYDNAPIQISQFESDIRIFEHLDKIYFESGGGGNSFESYTAAWYMGARHTKLDCWGRGKKGIIITIGDELLNPYLPARRLCQVTGDTLQADVSTKDLYNEVIEKYNLYHLAITDSRTYHHYKLGIEQTFGKYLDKDHFRSVSLNDLAATIVDIVVSESQENIQEDVALNENGEIVW